MKLRWRLVLALAAAGILPLIHLLYTASSVIRTSARILAPENIGDALQDGLDLARDQFQSRVEAQQQHLESLALNLPHPPGDAGIDTKIDSFETLYCCKDGSWWVYRANQVSWMEEIPEQEQPALGGELPEKIFSKYNYDGMDWILITVLDEEFRNRAMELRQSSAEWFARGIDRERLIKSLTWYFFITCLFVVAISILVAQFVVSKSTTRIEKLTTVTGMVADGNEGFRAEENGSDEVAQLARSFNRMLDNLIESRNQAAELEKKAAWRELARVLAHEIKNPLTPIQLSVQQLAQQYDGSDQIYGTMLNTTREIVDEEVESLRKLVKEFSDFARAPRMEPEPCDVEELVEDIAALYSNRLTVEINTDVSDCTIDREKIKRAIINLVGNAINAAGKEKEVVLRLQESGNNLVFEVEDDGPGVPEDAREKIFEPYFTTRGTGIGLGLPIVRTIAEQHGGGVVCMKGEKFDGALFRLWINSSNTVEDVNDSDNMESA